MLSSPNTQAGFKYWLVLCIVFEVTLGLLYSEPALRPLNPGFGFVAASLTMSQKVEATVSKVRCRKSAFSVPGCDKPAVAALALAQ